VTVFNLKHKTEIISLIVIFFALVIYALSKDNLDILSLLIGLSLAAIPFRILYWSEKGTEANRIAFHLRQDLGRLKREEQAKNGDTLGVSDITYPLEDNRFKIINTTYGESWYSKQYDVWFLEGTSLTYFCDKNLNPYGFIRNPYQFNLKKSLIPNNDIVNFNKEGKFDREIINEGER
jgi:hypothetical protein